MTPPEVDSFLDGPRARSLCIAILSPQLWSAGWNGISATPGTFTFTSREVDSAIASFARALEEFQPDDWHEPADLLPALGLAVDSSKPWRPPYGIDAIAELEPVRRYLRPMAEAVLASKAASWWDTDCAIGDQWWVSGWDDDVEFRIPVDAATTRRRWRDLVQQREVATDTSGRSVRKIARGAWWSKPAIWDGPGRAAALPASSRRLGPLGAVELAAQEDSFAPTRATLRRLDPPPSARIFEIHEPADWIRLVDTYPLSVRWAYRGTWWESTGLDTEWRLPDYAAAGDEWDGIHVSPIGYLTTAGRPLPGGCGMTMLAGWDPDATFWLNDVAVGEAEQWIRTGDDMHVWDRLRPT